MAVLRQVTIPFTGAENIKYCYSVNWLISLKVIFDVQGTNISPLCFTTISHLYLFVIFIQREVNLIYFLWNTTDVTFNENSSVLGGIEGTS